MNSRTDVINEVVKIRGSETYLEIGVRNPTDNFNLINCKDKIGVDLAGRDDPGKGFYRMSSDDFFDMLKEKDSKGKGHLKISTFDLIFIDGGHTLEQARKDIINALEYLNEDGVIVIHDCLPQSYEEALPVKPKNGRPWCGEVYKAFCRIRTRKDLFSFTVNIDHGCGIIFKATNPQPSRYKITGLDFRTFWQYHPAYLWLVNWNDFKNMVVIRDAQGKEKEDIIPSKPEPIKGSGAFNDEIPAEEIETREDEGEKEKPDPRTLVAYHAGRGRWKVADAVTDEPIHEGTLSKDEAKKMAEGGLET